ncbi:MAG: hypothetical protein H0V25_06245, partial [Solirubrobacterales bacterium]|nr:hypothetical protein [Solirubrobacterales bacterium]
FVIIVVGIWWKVSAHKYFTGQTRNVEIDQALEGKDDGGSAGSGSTGTGPAPAPVGA